MHFTKVRFISKEPFILKLVFISLDEIGRATLISGGATLIHGGPRKPSYCYLIPNSYFFLRWLAQSDTTALQKTDIKQL